ncbi:TetR/AcrR family transcriptional regulator [Aliidiomarina minuta]|uniref:TetR/AcrR family transcriptional regulator n=1 Tax=Aliidiomarina minuta TaxID=880057 RepID=A0A432W9C0_9GAMM|nr:TetR/AcrR family transcriptional regulator [Aliidiomarina minuta]RUO26651.1 TetR/AcrR family transcriptional regulator [Aliidiomarina minuta]
MTRKTSRGGRPSKRNDILMAAEKLVKEQGASHLTFDRLSEETGISKGGLLYHFASKEELVLAMMVRLLDTRQVLREEMQAQFSGEDADIKSLIMAEAGQESSDIAMDSAILCAAATNRELMTPMRGRFRELLSRFDASEMGGDKARIALFAVYGERLMQQLGMIDHNSEERKRFLQTMEEFIR